ncbi:MAG: ribulose-phosphate 3-epimerase [Clostridia bacterium]
MIKIAPSILAADFSKLGEEVMRVEKAGADFIHIDVMDGHFVPNITIGPPVIKDLRKTTKLPFDVHLMIEDPDRYVDAFIDAGADILTIHYEACPHLNRIIQHIREQGILAGVSLNPSTPVSSLEDILPFVDMVLLMTVNPGFGGQTYIREVNEKIKRLREMIHDMHLDVDIEIDGGVTLDNLRDAVLAGANVIVAGSTIYQSDDPGKVIRDMKIIGEKR